MLTNAEYQALYPSRRPDYYHWFIKGWVGERNHDCMVAGDYYPVYISDHGPFVPPPTRKGQTRHGLPEQHFIKVCDDRVMTFPDSTSLLAELESLEPIVLSDLALFGYDYFN